MLRNTEMQVSRLAYDFMRGSLVQSVVAAGRKPDLPLYVEFPNLSKEKPVATRNGEAVRGAADVRLLKDRAI